MGGIRHRARWSRAVLALLAALALLVAPLAGAQAMPCHDPAGHQHAAPPSLSSGQASGLTADHQDRGPERAAVDHKACCGASCAVCLVVAAREDAAVLQRPAVGKRFESSDQADSGVALQPALGPPRLPV